MAVRVNRHGKRFLLYHGQSPPFEPLDPSQAYHTHPPTLSITQTALIFLLLLSFAMNLSGSSPMLVEECERLINEIVPQLRQTVRVKSAWSVLVQDQYIALRGVVSMPGKDRQIDLNEPTVYNMLQVMATHGLHGSVFVDGVCFGFKQGEPQ